MRPGVILNFSSDANRLQDLVAIPCSQIFNKQKWNPGGVSCLEELHFVFQAHRHPRSWSNLGREPELSAVCPLHILAHIWAAGVRSGAEER